MSSAPTRGEFVLRPRASPMSLHSGAHPIKSDCSSRAHTVRPLMENSAKASVATAWLRSSPEAKKQQVDAALEYALESTLQVRPAKPLMLVAQKLREWDDAVNGKWPLRSESEAVFARADADGSGQLDLAEMTAMRASAEYGELMLTNLDMSLDGKVSMAEWLIAMKANVDKNEEATKKMLELYDAYLSGEKKPQGGKKGRRE